MVMAPIMVASSQVLDVAVLKILSGPPPVPPISGGQSRGVPPPPVAAPPTVFQYAPIGDSDALQVRHEHQYRSEAVLIIKGLGEGWQSNR